ncbi:hypothetical protein FQR65_LT01314 [Abscondita terminalis]|nr:hypothetical protein FQR65_LT01314 [Abscondita terminalis]
MEEEKLEPTTPSDAVPDSPKPLAFTIDFGQSHDTQRHKALVEKFQNRHRRGQSLSKLEDTPPQTKKHPSTGNLPRKSSFQSEGYFSSDENRNVRSNNMRLRSELSLPLKNLAGGCDKMTQSFPNGSFLDTIRSPDVETKMATPSPVAHLKKLVRHLSSPEVETRLLVTNESEEKFIDGNEVDFDKSDTVSDAGTYTLDTDNYTEEQKARMSIDREFNIEQISIMKKTEEYVQSLTVHPKPSPPIQKKEVVLKSPEVSKKVLSPILSPTQNLSIVDVPNRNDHNTINKILYPSPKAKTGINQASFDQGCFTSVTSSGAFSRKGETRGKGHMRQPSLTKSEVQIQTYVDVGCAHTNGVVQTPSPLEPETKLTNLPPPIGGVSGKNSPTKIPSPVHAALTRPRSRNSVSSLNIDLSDSSLETESFLKPTQNYINSLQKRISLDSDQDSDYDTKSNVRLNNETRDLLKQKTLHVRHNSFDDKNVKISNKLEHFQNKNLQGIDQTYTNKLNQYPQKVHKLQNSPNNSPIRRSSSFSNKNHFINQPKVSNIGNTKDVNLRNSPNLNQNGSIQRSSSTANIKPNLMQLRRSSVNSEHSKIDRNQFGDTESSSEDDFDKILSKKKDLSNITNTRYNRAFSLRRARLDSDQPVARCPNTPEMRRKFQPNEHLRSERAISVDRRPIKTNEVPSRYLQSISSKNKNLPEKIEVKNVPKPSANVIKSLPGKPQVFSRTDSGRFSVRSTKPLPSNTQKSNRKDGGGKKQSGGRSNSSLSSREVEFQNWKRRKSYDPMKAAAEGKKKAELAKKHNLMTQSYNENQDCDSSPSHSSSVHRSQSFHGTAAIEQLISSEEDDLTLSADECFSPPTPSPCELSPARNKIRHVWRDRLLHKI